MNRVGQGARGNFDRYLFADAVAQSFQTVCKLRATVEIVEPGALPNDGKVIDDVREYE